MINNKRFIIGLVVLLISLVYRGNSQNTYTSASDSDKEAIKILNKTKDVLNNSKSIIFEYSLLVRMPEMEPQVTNGIAKQKGDKYYIEIGDKMLYCNGENVQVYSQTQNELQINDIDEDGGMLTPASVLNLFGEDGYIFVLGKEKKINRKKYYNLIFKPVERFSEYIKIEALIDKISFLPYKIKMLYRDGTKNILDINSAKINLVLDDNIFSFDKNKHPDVSIEDLRMN